MSEAETEEFGESNRFNTTPNDRMSRSPPRVFTLEDDEVVEVGNSLEEENSVAVIAGITSVYVPVDYNVGAFEEEHLEYESFEDAKKIAEYTLHGQK